jgi:flagellar motor switch protein FliN/FliY
VKASVEKVLTQGALSRVEQHPQWPLLSRLPMPLVVAVAVPHFKVRHLLALAVGQVIATNAPVSDDLPLEIAEVQLGWGEFEVVEHRMAIRLTRLA